MNILNKPADEINEDDLKTLIENKVFEKKTIDYKQNLKIKTDGEKKEFLADISSFANASGGQIIYGIKEKNGVPTEIVGIERENPDTLVSQINSIVQTSIRPKIPGFYVHPIRLDNDRIVIFIEIPKSWISPHMVTFSKGQRFTTRNSNGKYPMDVDDLRVAFTYSETIKSRIQDFRIDRISRIIANESPIPIRKTPQIIIHIIPIEAFGSNATYDVKKIYGKRGQLETPAGGGWDYRTNIDGVLTFTKNQDDVHAISYLQFFRNGIVEGYKELWTFGEGKTNFIASSSFESKTTEIVIKYLKLMKSLGIKPPLLIFYSFLNVKGYDISNNDYGRWSGTPINQDIIYLDEILLESFDDNILQLLKPTLDIVWNAGGYLESPNYGSNGNPKT